MSIFPFSALRASKEGLMAVASNNQIAVIDGCVLFAAVVCISHSSQHQSTQEHRRAQDAGQIACIYQGLEAADKHG